MGGGWLVNRLVWIGIPLDGTGWNGFRLHGHASWVRRTRTTRLEQAEFGWVLCKRSTGFVRARFRLQDAMEE